MRFEVLTVVVMEITVFWNVMPYGLINWNQCFRGTSYLHHWVKGIWHVGKKWM
jgi:hypothetical protein